MTREQFIQALRRYCRKNDLAFRTEESRGKGSHITVFVDERFTIVKSGQLQPGYRRLVLRQLGLPPDAV